jgi:Tol biopolymer transport system component
VIGAPVSVVEGVVQSSLTGAAQYDLSAIGSLVYVPGTGVQAAPSRLMWVDRMGVEQALPQKPHVYSYPRLSPDGHRVAVLINGPEADIWVGDLARDIWVLRISDRKAEPFLRTPFNEGAPRFSPDGHWLAYVSDESGRYEPYVQPYPGPGAKYPISTDGGTEPVWNPMGESCSTAAETK